MLKRWQTILIVSFFLASSILIGVLFYWFELQEYSWVLPWSLLILSVALLFFSVLPALLGNTIRAHLAHAAFFIGILFIIAGLVIPPMQEQDEQTYAISYATPIGTALTLHMIYPDTLPVGSTRAGSRALTAWIRNDALLTPTATSTITSTSTVTATGSAALPFTPTLPVTSTGTVIKIVEPLTYTIIFNHDPNILFTDPSGQPIPAQMDFNINNPVPAPRTLYLRPAPLQQTASPVSSLRMNMVIKPPALTPTLSIDAPGTLHIETQGITWRRLLLGRFLGDLAIPLGAATAIVGWGLQRMKEQQDAAQARLQQEEEQETRMRESSLQAINKVIGEDLPNALLRFLEVKKQKDQNPDKWKHHIDEINRIESVLERAMNDRTNIEGMLREAGDSLNRKNYIRYNEILSFFGNSFSNELRDHIKVLKIISPSEQKVELDDDKKQEIFSAVFWLWNHFDEDAQELVVQAAHFIGGEFFVEKWRSSTVDDENKRRVLLDARLRVFTKDRPPSLAYEPYIVDTLGEPGNTDQDVKKWLEDKTFTHPFAGRKHNPKLLIDTWAEPHLWNEMQNIVPTLIVSDLSEDRACVAHMLAHRLQQTVFVSRLMLASLAIDQHSPLATLYAITQSIGEAWLALLPKNPGGFFNLPLQDRHLVAELLLWTTGSAQAVRSRLLLSGLPEDAQGRMLLRRIDQAVRSERTLIQPDRNMCSSWIAIRPPGFSSTAVIIDDSIQDIPRLQHITTLITYAFWLWERKITLKVCTARPQPIPQNIPMIDVRWEDSQLRTMLKERLKKTLAGRTSLDFIPDPDLELDLDERLIQHANSSLARLLDYGNKLIHAYATSNELFLDKDDLARILV